MTTLVLGSFDMTKSDGTTRVLADGTSRGNPVPIEVTVKTWLQDGSVVITQGVDNREVHVRVRFFGTDLAALNALEASLMGELEKPNTLTWTPATGPATVFVVVTSSLDFVDEQVANEEQDDPWRTYDVRLVCEARTRSVAETVTAALSATGTTTTPVNDGSATTGWTGAVNGVTTAPSVVSGAVKVTNGSAVYGGVTCSLTLTASITTSSTKYLIVDWKSETARNIASLRAFGDGVELSRLSEAASPTAGMTRSTFYVTASSIAVLRLDSGSGGTPLQPPATVRSLYVDNINRSDVTPSIGTSRQLLRTIAVNGSARSQGALAIEHATSSLGDVMAYFFPNSAVGYSPPLRQYYNTGISLTTNSAMVSGSTNVIAAGGISYSIPTSKLAPGVHLLVIKADITVAPVVLGTTASTQVNGAAQDGTPPFFNTTLAVNSIQSIYPIGRFVLPTVDVDDRSTSASINISIVRSSGTGTVTIDEAWLFNTTIGQLVGPVACGTNTAVTGGSSNRLFLEPASPDRPRPTLRVGFAADRSDSHYPSPSLGGVKGWQLPVFTPPSVNVLTVTTNALDASLTYRSFPRWHTNAAL